MKQTVKKAAAAAVDSYIYVVHMYVCFDTSFAVQPWMAKLGRMDGEAVMSYD